MNVGDINRALRKARFPAGTRTSADRRLAVHTLWGVFTAHLQRELHERGQCALVAKRSGSAVQLFLEDGHGHLRGAFTDPLGIATAMLGRRVDRISCTEPCRVFDLETTLFALLGERPEPVGGDGIQALADRFVDGVREDGLPDVPGLDYRATEDHSPTGSDHRSSNELDAAGFMARVRSSRSATEILRVLHGQVLPYRRDEALEPFIRPLMSAARHYNETRDDVRSAVDLWSEAAALNATTTGRAGVVAIMMNVARKRASADLPPARRDVAGAVQIYEAVFGLDVSEDQNQRLVKTMMAVANLYTDLKLPPEHRDVPGAVALWASVLGMDLPASERDYVLRSMMKVANMLTDLRVPGREIDVRGAVTIWRAVCDHGHLEDDWHRTIRTMMAMANRLTSPDRQLSMDDFRAAVHLWQAAYTLCLEREEEQALRVVRTMMDVANHVTDFSGRVTDLALRGAIEIWRGIADCSALTDDRVRAIRTMMALAGRRIGAYSDRDSVLVALRLWHAAYGCATDDEGRYRVVKTIMDLADKYPAICADAIDILRRDRSAFDAPGFEIQAQAGLLYFQQEHEAVVSLAEGAGRDAPVWVAALRAEAQRKLGDHHEAIAACGELITRCAAPGASRPQSEALVSALCCRGYCHLELGRSDPSSLPQAMKDLERSLAVARDRDVPEPPRAHSGIGYVRQLQGRDDEAEEAFARARQLDADNLKAAAGTTRTHSGSDDDGGSTGHHVGRRALMREARRLNELHNDVDGAIARWSEAHALRLPGDDSSAVVAIMMAVARKRSSSALAPEHRDVPGAVRIYEAVQALGITTDQRQRVVRTMMAAAARFTDRALPAEELDVDGATTLWRSVHAMAEGDEERRRVTRVMRVVADRMESDGVTATSSGSSAAERLRGAITQLRPGVV